MVDEPHNRVVEHRVGAALIASAAVTLAALLALALVQALLPSRTLTLDELRAGVDFGLAGVRVNETYFLDRSLVDGGTRVAFLVHFADGASENVSFVYQIFVCQDVTTATAHTGPQMVFSTRCGESSVLVWVR